MVERKRPPMVVWIVFIIALGIGFLGLYRVTQSPSYEMYRTVDIVQLLASGVCFGASPKLRTVIWDFAGERLSEDLCADVSRLAVELDAGALRQAMLGLLSRREVDATAARARALVAAGRFPVPSSSRAYPWPPV